MTNPDSVSAPQFQLFETALHIYKTDKGFYSDSVIKIMGMELDIPDSSKQGWFYFGQALTPPTELRRPTKHRYVCAEDELFKSYRTSNDLLRRA